jgi:2-polyprenyl-3-methyl-5-hydroxy-6-metoxy-1,4-benzoquinol methylase
MMSLDRFNKCAKQWDSKPQRVKSALMFVDEIFKNIKEDTSNFNVLDYGCGSGLVSFGLREYVSSVIGMDYSIGMIKEYNNKVSKLSFDNISSSLHDINNQDLDKELYDLITTNMTMHHIKDTNIFIKKLSLGLKKGGYLAIADIETEDGTFHSDNQGVEHFGFDTNFIKNLYLKNNLDIVVLKELQIINKEEKLYNIFIAIGKKL